jgi:hypothetical protein
MDIVVFPSMRGPDGLPGQAIAPAMCITFCARGASERAADISRTLVIFFSVS